MKILIWNIQRPKKANQAILDKLAEYNADIVVLTKTNTIIIPGKEYSPIETKTLIKGHNGIKYHKGENRIAII